MALQDEIDHLKQLLNSGLSATAADGERHEYDPASIRRRLAELEREQNRAKRPRTSSIDLSGW